LPLPSKLLGSRQEPELAASSIPAEAVHEDEEEEEHTPSGTESTSSRLKADAGFFQPGVKPPFNDII